MTGTYKLTYPGATVDDLLQFLKQMIDSNQLSITTISLNGYRLTSSGGNFISNSNVNSVDSAVGICVINGGQPGWANRIGYAGKPTGTDITPIGWDVDSGYPGGASGVSCIHGGYDHITNQIASTICGGGHNFIKYNNAGHSFIGGGSYNLISAGRSMIGAGQGNAAVGDGRFLTIPGGYSNNILDGSYSSILGGDTNVIATGSNSAIIGGADNIIVSGSGSVILGGTLNSVNGDYSLSFGNRAKTTASGTISLSDSTNSDFTVGTQDVFGCRFAGGYWFTGGNVGIGTKTPAQKTHIQTNTDGTDVAALRIDNMGTLGYQSAIEFFSPNNSSGITLRSGRIYSVFTGASYSTSRITIQSIKSGNVATDTLSVCNGGVGIGTVAPSEKAALDVVSTTKGFLPPRMTTTQRDAISTPPEGLQIYNLTTHKINFYNGTEWETVTSGVV